MASKIGTYADDSTAEKTSAQAIQDTWRSLNLRISADPMNIKLHTQRQLFALENNLTDYVAGALQDLYICLGNRGAALRQRMFDLLSPVMVQPDREYFRSWLEAGSDAQLDCHHFPGAVFSSDTCRREDDSQPSSLAPERKLFKNNLEEALYNLESGQLVKGRAMLEDICLQQSGNTIATQWLQSVFTLTQEEKPLESFIERYRENHKVLPDDWQHFLQTNRQQRSAPVASVES